MEAPADVGGTRWNFCSMAPRSWRKWVQPLVVDGDVGAGADPAAQLDGLPGRHAVAPRPGDREAHAAKVEQGGVDDLAEAVVEHGVAADPQFPWAWPSQARAKPITSPTIGRLSGGPWRHGVAVT